VIWGMYLGSKHTTKNNTEERITNDEHARSGVKAIINDIKPGRVKESPDLVDVRTKEGSSIEGP